MGSMEKATRDPAVLTTKRLFLRPLKIVDAPRLARLTNDPLVTNNLLKTEMPFTVNDARALILRARKKRSPVWAIDNGQLIGVIGIAGEFGYWLARSAWGRGYAYEAARVVIDYAFERLNIDALHASPIADNRASRHLLKKLGFQEDGTTRATCLERGNVVALIRYRLDRRTWQEA
ncbi:GNAT family N-acetyltransferase [Agrobacterium larrymoorei]|uniref:GNAT family N-acetyltransferase n=1 Tax=Agrobacterium larrymoorei TaxID=160699 RepID=UPI0030BAB319